MTTTVNASNSGSGGLIQTADASGILALQTAGTTAVTIDTSQNATFVGYANLPNTFGFKNRLINGAMVIDQRNAGASITPTNTQYTVDRFWAWLTQASKFTTQQSSVAPPGFSNSLLVTSSSAYSVLAADYFAISQRIEGYNWADMAYGTASAQTATLSFWVRSSLTGTFGGSLENSAQNRSYPFNYTISSQNTWEQKSITIPGDTAGTWIGGTNGIGIQVNWGLGVGSNNSNTAGAWVAAGAISSTSATSVVGTSGATWQITGVQLEKGSTATSFDVRPYGTELLLCYRYYQQATSNGTTPINFGGFAQNSTTGLSFQTIQPPMRTAPTGTIIGATASNWIFSISGGADMTASSMTINEILPSQYTVQLTCASSGVSSGQGGRIRTGTSGYGISLSAEL